MVRPHRRALSRWALTWASVLWWGAVVGVGAASGEAGEKAVASTTRVGRAIVAYRDPLLQVAAAYNYSQRNHDGRWLFVELAVTSSVQATLHRDSFAIETPDGRLIPLASPRAWNADYPAVRQLLQNAKPLRAQIRDFVTVPSAWRVRLFAAPFEGTVENRFPIDQFAVVQADLFFEMEDGGWEPGRYHLIVRQGKLEGRLPIDLE